MAALAAGIHFAGLRRQGEAGQSVFLLPYHPRVKHEDDTGGDRENADSTPNMAESTLERVTHMIQSVTYKGLDLVPSMVPTFDFS